MAPDRPGKEGGVVCQHRNTIATIPKLARELVARHSLNALPINRVVFAGLSLSSKPRPERKRGWRIVEPLVERQIREYTEVFLAQSKATICLAVNARSFLKITTMTKTKHTPGPWAKSYIGKVCIGVGAKSVSARGVYTEMVCNTILPETDAEYAKQKDQIEADMSLIAAAPELLEALEKLTKAASRSASVMDLLRTELEKAKAVIGKAKGE